MQRALIETQSRRRVFGEHRETGWAKMKGGGGGVLNRITTVPKYQKLLTMAPIARHIVAGVAATTVRANAVDTVGEVTI